MCKKKKPIIDGYFIKKKGRKYNKLDSEIEIGTGICVHVI